MPRKFHEWRSEAEALNAQAQSQSKPEPIPDYAQLRLKPLARQVLQARLNVSSLQGGADEH